MASQAWEAGSIPVSRSTSKGVENQLLTIFGTFVVYKQTHLRNCIFDKNIVVLRAFNGFCCE